MILVILQATALLAVFIRISHILMILVILQATALLTAFIRTSHILMYAPSDSFTCRLAVT
ncbi:MAG TPA: hypothetical protein DIS95_02055 [Proteus vulgaris]|nr:hypothetical protein [Proteus vulgaris]